MFCYSAYGLTLHSTLPLPELRPSTDREADVVIRSGSIDWHPTVSPDTWDAFYIDGDEAYLYWRVVGKFRVKAGREIWVDPLPTVADSMLRLPLLGAVLAMLLHQRGLLVLHASAVAIDGQAALFLGPKGQGKSTMAAALYGQGCSLMADDVAAIDLSHPEAPRLLPGFPQIKLYPEAVIATLGDDPGELRRLHPEVEKRARPTRENFGQTPLAIGGIYVLGHADHPQILPLSSQKTLVNLIVNSYIPALIGDLFPQTPQAAVHMQQCTVLAQHSSIRRLVRPRSLDLLPAIARLIREDLTCALHTPLLSC